MSWKWKAIRKGYIKPNSNKFLKVYINGANLLTQVLVKTALKSAWKKVNKTPPPQDTASSKIPWRDAIIWTALYSLTVGMAGLIGRRLARACWDKALS